MPWREEAEENLPPLKPTEPAQLRLDILDELEDHLACAVVREREVCDNGDSAVWGRVLERFGDPAALARRLWWDAMREAVMREWTQTIVIALLAIVMVVFMGLMARQMQAGNEAIISTLAELKEGEVNTFTELEVTLRKGDENGPPVSGRSVRLFGKLFEGQDSATLNHITDESGKVTFGPIRQGSYTLQTNDHDTDMSYKKTIVCMGGKEQMTIITPPDIKTPVHFDAGLPAYVDDDFQYLLLSGSDTWKEWEKQFEVLVKQSGTINATPELEPYVAVGQHLDIKRLIAIVDSQQKQSTSFRQDFSLNTGENNILSLSLPEETKAAFLKDARLHKFRANAPEMEANLLSMIWEDYEGYTICDITPVEEAGTINYSTFSNGTRRNFNIHTNGSYTSTSNSSAYFTTPPIKAIMPNDSIRLMAIGLEKRRGETSITVDTDLRYHLKNIQLESLITKSENSVENNEEINNVLYSTPPLQHFSATDVKNALWLLVDVTQAYTDEQQEMHVLLDWAHSSNDNYQTLVHPQNTPLEYANFRPVIVTLKPIEGYEEILGKH